MEKYKNQIVPDEISLSVKNQQEENPVSDVEIVKKLVNAKRNNETLRGLCVKAQKDGTLIIALSNNIKGYIPRNEVSYRVEEDGNVHLDKCRTRVGLNVPFKVLEVKEEDGELKAILSRKKVMEEIRDNYKRELEEGMIVKGVVIGMQIFGAYIDIGGDVVGLLPTKDVTRVYIKHPEEVLNIGDVVEVAITRKIIKDDDLKFVFNRAILLPSFDKIDEKYQVGETVLGKVKTKMDTGIFVELDECFEGLADYPKNRKVEYGDKVRVVIQSINKEKERIRLKII